MLSKGLILMVLEALIWVVKCTRGSNCISGLFKYLFLTSCSSALQGLSESESLGGPYNERFWRDLSQEMEAAAAQGGVTFIFVLSCMLMQPEGGRDSIKHLLCLLWEKNKWQIL